MHTIVFLLLIISYFFIFLKVFEINDVKAWKSVLVSVASYSLGLVMIAKAPWYLLPLAWAWTGTAITGVSLNILSGCFPFPFSSSHPYQTCNSSH